jgi:CheY-like chemotaxis protein
MDRNILLVDDHRDIVRLLHSTLDTLKNKEIKIFEAPSGEEALLESTRHKIDLLVADYKLPGISGVELMHKVRARFPEVQVIFITGMTDKKMRDEMLNAGALAIFDKPIPMADFLDVVERGLGLVQTIFPPRDQGNRLKNAAPGFRICLPTSGRTSKPMQCSCLMTAVWCRRAQGNCMTPAWKSRSSPH